MQVYGLGPTYEMYVPVAVYWRRFTGYCKQGWGNKNPLDDFLSIVLLACKINYCGILLS